MDKEVIQQNRLWNFRQIVSSVDGVNEAARIMGKKNSYITQIAGPNPTRNIGNRMATSIEKSFGLPPGALDANPPKQSEGGDPYLASICSTLANASDNDKEFVLAMSEWIVGRSMKLPAKTKTGKIVQSKDVE